MTAAVSLLRGVNLAGLRRINMPALKALYESLGLLDVQSYLQSGNVVFRTGQRDLASLAGRIERAIEQSFGFHSDVILRTTAEMRGVLARNPFAGRPGIEPSRLVVTFLVRDPDRSVRIEADPEEVRIDGREVYVYYTNGIGRSKLTMTLLEKKLKTSGTGRNWNTVTRLLEMAEKLDAAG